MRFQQSLALTRCLLGLPGEADCSRWPGHDEAGYSIKGPCQHHNIKEYPTVRAFNPSIGPHGTNYSGEAECVLRLQNQTTNMPMTPASSVKCWLLNTLSDALVKKDLPCLPLLCSLDALRNWVQATMDSLCEFR